MIYIRDLHAHYGGFACRILYMWSLICFKFDKSWLFLSNILCVEGKTLRESILIRFLNLLGEQVVLKHHKWDQFTFQIQTYTCKVDFI